jgi:hypothetical protein
MGVKYMLLETLETRKIFPPNTGDRNIVERVSRRIRIAYGLRYPIKFQPYRTALLVEWPELFNADEKAFGLLATAIYMEIAEAQGFCIEPQSFRKVA